jgi:hypothetical protein
MDLALGGGDHACHLFTNGDEQLQVVLQFCEDGWRLNQCCLLTAAEATAENWRLELRARGAVQEELESSPLLIKAVRAPSNDFNAVNQARDLWRMIQPLLDRFEGVGLLREQPWQAELALRVEDLCHFELTKGLLFQDTDVRSICQYDLTNHSPAAIHTALRTHPLVIFEGKTHENPFYDGPAILEQEPFSFGSDADAAQVDHMLARFR